MFRWTRLECIFIFAPKWRTVDSLLALSFAGCRTRRKFADLAHKPFCANGTIVYVDDYYPQVLLLSERAVRLTMSCSPLLSMSELHW